MKKSVLSLWLTRLAWGLLALDLGLIFLIPADATFGGLAGLLIYTGGLFITLFVAVTWLMLAYRQVFRTWPGWAVPIVLLTLSNLVITGVLPIAQPNLALFFSVLGVISIWAIGPATAILLWRRDVGLGLIGWVMGVFVWALALAWRFQGNLLDLWLFALNHPAAPQPLWWLDPLICLTGWVIPLGIISFIGHTLRLLGKELR